jgi:N-acyl-L-homoserine lactone synthetase
VPDAASRGTAEAAAEAPSGEAEAVDRACAQVLESAEPLRVEPGCSAAEREACFRLRYRCVVENGWADPSDLPDGTERDAYDDIAVHICAWNGSELAGTVRLVFPRPGLTLPIEKEFGVELRPPGEVVDGGRLVVAPEHRGDADHRVLAALFSSCWLRARERGLHRFASVSPDRIVALYRRLGLNVEVLGEPRAFWGEERRPILLTGADPVALFPGARG